MSYAAKGLRVMVVANVFNSWRRYYVSSGTSQLSFTLSITEVMRCDTLIHHTHTTRVRTASRQRSDIQYETATRLIQLNPTSRASS